MYSFSFQQFFCLCVCVLFLSCFYSTDFWYFFLFFLNIGLCLFLPTTTLSYVRILLCFCSFIQNRIDLGVITKSQLIYNGRYFLLLFFVLSLCLFLFLFLLLSSPFVSLMILTSCNWVLPIHCLTIPLQSPFFLSHKNALEVRQKLTK